MPDDARSAPRAKFRAMTEGTAEDWGIIAGQYMPFAAALPDRVIEHLNLLKGDFGGFPVDRLTHCLQTAARAEEDGRDEEYVVCALLHDIGDTLGPYNHPDVAAAIIQPFVSEGYHWMVKHHGIFQGYYFFHHLGLDRNMRDQFAGHEHYDLTEEFCRKYDQAAFDPDYPTPDLAHYEPALRRVLAAPKQSVYKAALEE